MPDLLARLSHLAPDVDRETALVETRRRSRSMARRRRALAAAVVGVVALAATVVGARAGRDDAEGVVADIPDDGAATVTASSDGLELTVTVPDGHLVVGRRSTVEITVRNLRSGAIGASQSFAPCGDGFGHLEGTPFAGSTEETVWDERSPLVEQLRASRPPAFPIFSDEKAASSVGNLACPLPLAPLRELGPTQSFTWHGTIDAAVGLRFAPGVDLVVTAQGASEPTSLRRDITVETRLQLPLIDLESRRESADAAIDHLAADPRIPGYLDGDGSPSNLPTTTILRWWRGGWELWIDGRPNSSASLRLRYDPTVGRVIDARLVPHGLAADDEPGVTRTEQLPPDARIPCPKGSDVCA